MALLLRTLLLGGASLLAAFSVVSCDAPPPSDEAAHTHGREEARFRSADSLASRLIARADSALRRIEPLSSHEIALLRQYGSNDQLAYARRFGIEPVPDRHAAGALLGRPFEASGVLRLRTNDLYIVDPRMGYAVPALVPAAAELMERIGRRFQGSLLDSGLPPYRFIITNMLRTGVDQAYLRGVNTNAAAGESTHEYGTTADLYYGRFHYAPWRDPIAVPRDVDEARFRQRLHEAYREFGLLHADRIRAVLGRTLIDMQEEGWLVALYERGQPVFHLTVARAEEDGPDTDAAADDGPVPSGSTSGLAAVADDPAVRRFFANAESQLADVDDDLEDLEEDAAERPSATEPLLETLKTMRDSLWGELDRSSASEMSDSQLLRRLGAIDGEIERVRLELADTPQGVHSRLLSRLRRIDLAVSLLEGETEHDRLATHREDVRDLRARHDALENVLQQLEAPDVELSGLRSDAAAALSDLVADLVVLTASVDRM